jgi:hypothetical protein
VCLNIIILFVDVDLDEGTRRILHVKQRARVDEYVNDLLVCTRYESILVGGRGRILSSLKSWIFVQPTTRVETSANSSLGHVPCVITVCIFRKIMSNDFSIVSNCRSRHR